MAWTTPVTDRAPADIIARNSKAFLNVADWTRIYENTIHVRALYETITGLSTFTTLTPPTITTVPTVTSLNTLLINIQNLIDISAALVTIAAINTSWGTGNVVSPNYQDVNTWELALKTLYDFRATLLLLRFPRTGVALTGTGLTRQNGFRP